MARVSSTHSCDENPAKPTVPLAKSSPTEYFHRLRSIYATSGGVILGNVLEWYDWAVYGYMSDNITALFFHGNESVTWLVFAISFVARPFGATLLGWIGDTFGRKVQLNLAIWGMCLSTFFQGCICPWMPAPAYLLLCARLVAGISAGGESSGVSTYMSEVGGADRDHTVVGAIAVNNVSGGIAFFCANFVGLLVHRLPKEAQLSWGWRIPFLLAGPMGVLSILLRRHMKETEAFQELQESKKEKIVEMQRQDDENPPQAQEETTNNTSGNSDVAKFADIPSSSSTEFVCAIVLGVFVNAGVNAGNYFVVWVASWLTHNGMSASSALSVTLGAQVVRVLMTLPVSFYGDRRGLTSPMQVGSFLQAVTLLPVFFIVLKAADMGPALAFAVPFVLLGIVLPVFMQLANIPSPFFANCFFSADVRARGAGLTMGLASVMGGLTPLVGTELQKIRHWLPGLFLTLLMLISFCLITFSRVAVTKGWLKVHQRPWLF